MNLTRQLVLTVLLVGLTACSSLYYKGLEQVGIPKREVMVYRVEKARDTQQETKQQFKTALERFTALTQFNGGDLQASYDKLNGEYQASEKMATEVHKRIGDIEDVSEALFSEWEAELLQYSNVAMRRNSQQKLAATRIQYKQLITAMKQAEAKIQPVLTVFRDQVLYLKHNLNAQAIASLKGQLGSVQSDVSTLIAAMEKSIDEADTFIQNMEKP
ncbi:DUF2959 domain-containing protein [Methylomonas sp. HYX-M1]|uniref:DUF2959 domain-containing protein n=1 Tax=Methylomonas sp. HYX-M1 TaxID=3139307 RepID=UPI00345B6BEC